jgi:hypothetical protein
MMISLYLLIFGLSRRERKSRDLGAGMKEKKKIEPENKGEKRYK